MSDIWVAAILVLATWRISSLFSKEEGPFDIFTRLRSLPKGLGALFACLWCVSLWAGLLVALLSYALGVWLFVPFALSGAAILVDRLWPVTKD